MSEPHFVTPVQIKSKPHYHGDIVRKIFMLTAFIMILSLPFVFNDLPVPFIISLVVSAAVVVIAGVTNPAQRWVAVLNLVVSATAFVVFEYFTIAAYQKSGVDKPLFYINQLLAILYVVALYYSVKTARGFFVPEKK